MQMGKRGGGGKRAREEKTQEGTPSTIRTQPGAGLIAPIWENLGKNDLFLEDFATRQGTHD